MKKLLKILLVLLLLAVVAILMLPFWIKPVVTIPANIIAPRIVGTPFHLGDIGFNFYTGRLRVGDLQLSNPPNYGYSQREAFTLGSLEVEYETSPLFDKLLHIKAIRIKDVFVSYISSQGTNNIDHILANAGLSESEAEAPEAPDATETPEEEKLSYSEQVAKDEAAGEQELRIIIDRIEISGVLVQFGALPVPVPTITITDVGTASGGISLEAAKNDISGAVMKQVTDSLMNLGAVGLEEVKNLGKNAEKLGEDLLKDSDDAVKEVGETFKGLFKSARESLKGK